MSWSSIKTEGVVLRVIPIREADRSYSILTPDNGKIECLGRGAQKSQAKLASHLEPFSICEFEVIKGRRSTTIIGVDQKYYYKNIFLSVEKRILAQTSLFILDRYIRELDTDEGLYQILLDWLNFLNTGCELKKSRRLFLLGAFLLKILKRLGYEVELSLCLDCKEKIVTGSYKWHAGHGGLVCNKCVSEQSRDWFASRKVNENVLKMLRFAREQTFDDLLKLSLEGVLLTEYSSIINDLVQFHVPGATNVPFWEGAIFDV